MATTLTITTSLVVDHWEISGSITSDLLPAEVFKYTNTGMDSLGTYVGIASLDEISRMQVFTGTAIPIFANKFVRYASLNVSVPINTPTTPIVSIIQDSIAMLSAEYKTKLSTTQVIQIL